MCYRPSFLENYDLEIMCGCCPFSVHLNHMIGQIPACLAVMAVQNYAYTIYCTFQLIDLLYLCLILNASFSINVNV